MLENYLKKIWRTGKMGYTHYITKHSKEFNQNIWDSFIADCKYLSNHLPEHTDSAGGYYIDDPLALSGGYFYKKAQFTKNQIFFNGRNRVKTNDGWKDENDNFDLRHEDFVLKRKDKDEFSCCKTARKPYDLMVVSCLILAKWYFKDDISISSDGTMKDWQSGFDFVGSVLPNGITIVTELKLSSKFFN